MDAGPAERALSSSPECRNPNPDDGQGDQLLSVFEMLMTEPRITVHVRSQKETDFDPRRPSEYDDGDQLSQLRDEGVASHDGESNGVASEADVELEAASGSLAHAHAPAGDSAAAPLSAHSAGEGVDTEEAREAREATKETECRSKEKKEPQTVAAEQRREQLGQPSPSHDAQIAAVASAPIEEGQARAQSAALPGALSPAAGQRADEAATASAVASPPRFPALALWQGLIAFIRAAKCKHRQHDREGLPCFTGRRAVAMVLLYFRDRPEARYRDATYNNAVAVAGQLHRQGVFVAVKASKNNLPLASNLHLRYRVAPANDVRGLPG